MSKNNNNGLGNTNKHNKFSIIGFILSLVSLIYFLVFIRITDINFIYLPAFIILSICGLVFSIIGLSKPNYKKSLSIAGIVVTTLMLASILATFIIVITFIALY